MFTLLVVEDNPADVRLLRSLLKTLKRPHDAYFVVDGLDALDFLHCRGPYHDAPRPNLILADLNMPRMNGHELLAHIKGDSELSAIPVIILSSSSAPVDIHRAYQAHANCYVPKATNLDQAYRLMQAIEAFWLDVAVLPPCEERPKHGNIVPFLLK